MEADGKAQGDRSESQQGDGEWGFPVRGSHRDSRQWRRAFLLATSTPQGCNPSGSGVKSWAFKA